MNCNVTLGIRILILPAVLVGCLFFSDATFAQDDKPTVVGYSVAKAVPDDEYNRSYANSLQAGTSVYVNVNLEGKTIIKVNDPESDDEIKMTDSTGKEMPDAAGSLAFMSNISDDAQSVVLSFQSRGTPDSKAESISIKGPVVLICGADEKTDSFDAKVEDEGKMEIAGIEMEVSDVQDSFFDEGFQSFEITSKKSLSKIKSMKVILETGTEVELQTKGRSEWGFGDEMTYQRTLQFEGKAADVRKIKVTYFEKLEEVGVSLDVSFTLGLPE